jgi:aspartate/methionine/tyrosine aminotransferase
VGEPAFDTPVGIREAAVRALAAGDTRYTPRLGFPELREAVRVRLARDKGFHPAFEDAVITAGGSPAACISIAATCQSGDTIVVPDPAWPNYDLFAARIGVGVRRYRYSASRELDLEEIDSLIDATTKLLIINSPANPTGAVATKEEMASLVELAARRTVWILSDEAYEGIVFDGERAWSPCALGGSDRTFAAYTFSKTYAMTGWRVGYLIIPSEFRRAALELQATMTGCAPSMAQRGAEHALRHCDEEAETMRRVHELRRNLALSQLDGSGIVDGTPRGAFYLWLSIERSGMTGQRFADWIWRQAGVRVSAGEVYSRAEPHHVRASFATDERSLGAGLGRIQSALDSLADGEAPPSGDQRRQRSHCGGGG